MSALAVIRTETAIVIGFDTIAYGSNGVIRSVTAGKVLAMPELRCIIGNTGIGNFTNCLRAHIGLQYASFDDLIVGAPLDFLVTLRFMKEREPELLDSTPCTVFYAGWSDKRSRFETYRISALDKRIINGEDEIVVPAFTLVPLMGDWCSKAIKNEDYERFGLNRNERNPFDIAVGYICAARATSCVSTVVDDTYAVGGDLHVMILHREKLTETIAHRWPDKVGELLDPTAGEIIPAWLIPAEPKPPAV